MNKAKILNYLQKNSPHILVGVGVVGVIIGTVMACKATRKADAVIEVHQAEVEEVKLKATVPSEEPVNEKKELTMVYFKTGANLVKVYLPSAVVIGGSLGCVLGSHYILNKRNIALGAAYTALDTCFKQYRQNIIDKYGESADVEARYSVKAKKVKGQEEPQYEATENTYENKYSAYCRIFDETNDLYVDNAEYNLMFLRHTEQWANDVLQKRHMLFLNEVYRALGFEETKAGQVVGWVYDPENPSGDNYVSFGIYDFKNPAKRDFINGHEKSIILDFNVDGNIWALMK